MRRNYERRSGLLYQDTKDVNVRILNPVMIFINNIGRNVLSLSKMNCVLERNLFIGINPFSSVAFDQYLRVKNERVCR